MLYLISNWMCFVESFILWLFNLFNNCTNILLFLWKVMTGQIPCSMSNNIDCPHNQINRSGGYESGFITHIYWLNKFTSNRIFNKSKGMFELNVHVNHVSHNGLLSLLWLTLGVASVVILLSVLTCQARPCSDNIP